MSIKALNTSSFCQVKSLDGTTKGRATGGGAESAGVDYDPHQVLQATRTDFSAEGTSTTVGFKPVAISLFDKSEQRSWCCWVGESWGDKDKARESCSNTLDPQEPEEDSPLDEGDKDDVWEGFKLSLTTISSVLSTGSIISGVVGEGSNIDEVGGAWRATR